MERCQEHVIADGEVERSRKMNGVVERIRICKKCGSRFKTFELADDQLAKEQAEYDKQVMELKREVEYCRGIFKTIRTMDEMVETLKEEVRREYEFGNENRD